MKEKINKLRNKICNSNFVIMGIFLILVFTMTKTATLTAGDDQVYKNAFFDFNSMITWAVSFANVWSGRIIASGVSTIFLNVNFTIYKIINTLMVLVLICGMDKLVKIGDSNKKDKVLLIFSMALFFFINISVMNEGIIWVTGTFNYLWPCTAMIIALIPYIKLIRQIEIKGWEYFLYIPASIYASNVEQTGAILLVFGFIAFITAIIQKSKKNGILILNYLLSTLITIVSLLVPGNTVRAQAETVRYYQNFDMLSTFDKIFQGLCATLEHLVNNTSILLFIISVLVFYKIYKDNQSNKNEKQARQQIILAAIPMGYMLLKILPINVLFSRIVNSNSLNMEAILDKFLYRFLKYGAETISNPRIYIPIVIATFIIILMAGLIYLAFKDKKKASIYTLIYLAGIASSLVISFSPTIFASGTRIFMVNDIMIIVPAIAILNEILKEKKYKLKEMIFFCGIVIIAILHALRFLQG